MHATRSGRTLKPRDVAGEPASDTHVAEPTREPLIIGLAAPSRSGRQSRTKPLSLARRTTEDVGIISRDESRRACNDRRRPDEPKKTRRDVPLPRPCAGTAATRVHLLARVHT
jgi:hypothetical protein